MRLRIRWKGLRTKIIAWSFVPTAIILTAVALVNFYAYQQVTEELVIERDRDLTHLFADQLAMGLTEHADLLTSLARAADIYQGDPAAQRDALKKASNRLTVFDGGMLILDTFGKVTATEPERPEILGQDWSDRDFYLQILRSQISRSSGPVFSDTNSGDGPGAVQTIVIAVPITGEQGEFMGTVVGMFRLDMTDTSLFYDDIAPFSIEEHGNAYLVGGGGRVIYHSDPDRIGQDFSGQVVVQRVLNGEVDAIRTHDFDNRDIVSSFAPVPGTSWGLVTEESWAALISASHSYRWFLMSLLALGLVVPALVVAFGVSRITQPIVELISAAQEVARGNFGQEIGARTGDELEELAEQFNSMSVQLQESYVNLERKVADRTREAENSARAAREAQQAAEAANRAKSTFLANMSHELRTPLNAILGFSEMMMRDSNLTAEQRENLETIGRSGEHLLALINDVLELSKIESGRATVQETSFDLYHLLTGIEEMFRLRAKAKGLALVLERTPDVPQYVRLDENKLRQVLINLLSNAVKFTKVGSIMLRVRSKEYGGRSKEYEVGSKEAALLHFEVEDTGIGIAPEELNAVFDTFVQTASGKQSYQGTGLGMPISRRFVRMMGGDITVSSELGKGTTFKFDVPVRLADPDKVQAAYPTRRVIGLEPGQRAADGSPYRLLVAEDKAVNRALLLKLLKPLGFDVREAVNGQEAIEIWEEWHPHLIWMDMRMPILDGYEATKHIKSRIENRKPKVETVIIALTASAFEEDRATALASGCDDFVRKPFREIELFDTLAKHLGVRFVYEEAGKQVEKGTERTSPTERLSVTALAAMPSGWLTDMYQATLEGDLSWMATLGEQIQDANLADTLSELINDFEHDMILDLIRLAQA